TGQLCGTIDCILMTGDYDLLRRVYVRRLADFALSCLAANRRDLLQCQSQNCSHRAHTYRDCLLHISAAISDGTDCIREGYRAGSYVRRIFTQAMTGNESRFHSLFVEHPPGCDGCRENRRLSNLREPKLIFGSFKTKLR